MIDHLLFQQLAACNSQKCSLESALNCEKERARNHIRGLEKKISDMNEQVIAKAKDITNAREAQVTLQTEINTYKTLLDQDQRYQNLHLLVSLVSLVCYSKAFFFNSSNNIYTHEDCSFYIGTCQQINFDIKFHNSTASR